MSFISAAFKSIQAGNMQVGAAYTLPIAVDPAHTFLIFGGCASNDKSGFPCGTGSGYITLLNPTTVQSYAYLGNGVINFTAIETFGTFLRSPVQYAGGSLAGGATAVGVAIAPVGPKAFVVYLGITEDITIQADMASVTGRASLFNPTTVLCERFGNGGVNTPDNAVIAFCVIDPK